VTEYVLKISGLRCANCARTVQKAIEQLPEVQAEVNFATEEAIVQVPGSLSVGAVISAVETAGYGAAEVRDILEMSAVETDRLQQARFWTAIICAIAVDDALDVVIR
jgi:Cu+-exporting ATPase